MTSRQKFINMIQKEIFDRDDIWSENYPEDWEDILKYDKNGDNLLDYDEYVALEHIEDIYDSKDLFNKDIDIPKLFKEIQNYLTEETKVKGARFNDIYIIDYPNVGANGENHLKVVTLFNTKNILTFFPIHKVKYEEEKYASRKILLRRNDYFK